MPRHRSQRGIALAWTAIVLIVMVGMVGLCIDWGKVTWNVHQIQNAADAAALAGAQIVKLDRPGAITRTHDFALMNYADGRLVTLRTTGQPEPFSGSEDPYDIIVGRWATFNRTFIPTLDAPNAVKAFARRKSGLGTDAPPFAMIFGPIFGTSTVPGTRAAIACCFDSSGSGLICLSSSATPGLWLSGTADLDVDGGGIHVNSTAWGDNQSAGAWVQGSAQLDCGFLNVVGAASPDAGSTDWEDVSSVGGFSVGDVTTVPAPSYVPDPVAAALAGNPYVVAPDNNSLDLPTLITNGTIPTRSLGTITDSNTLLPGYYPGGIRLTTTSANVVLQPTSSSGLGTLFVFGGGTSGSTSGMVLHGGRLEGHGVTCYVTKNFGPGGRNGVIDATTSAVDLWSPGDWQNHLAGTNDLSLVQGLNGIAVWQDPTMTPLPDVGLNGSADFGIHGTLYFPNPIYAVLNGNLGDVGNQIVCGSAKVLGRAVITVNYDGRNSPMPTRSSLLVR